ncbi:MAG TPA: hypothetical protein VFU21_25460 [Kofleriaceae bacterium]|nr:hypothetical protein [Kofleriaceae bacterium]
MKTALATVALAGLLSGCQSGDEKRRQEPAPATTERPAAISAEDLAVIDAMAQFIAGLGAAVDANQADCDRMAAALAPVMERGKPVLAKARALETRLSGDAAALEWATARTEEKAGGVDRIMSGVNRCSDHPGVQQALSGFIQ